MNKKNLFIVASPLQFLNAMEAMHYFKTSCNILILIYNSSLNETDYNQKLNLLDVNEWEEVIYYDLAQIAKKRRFFEQVKLIKKLKKDTYTYLFSGDFGTIQQALMANLDIENIYLLDDGTASLVTYEVLKDKHFIEQLTFSKKMKLMRYRLMNLKYKIEQDINFFTIYNLKPLPHMKVIQHDFRYLKKSRLRACKKSNNIYILGQNLVEVGWITEEKYLQYLEKIIEKLLKEHSGKIIYKPHRSEKITMSYYSLQSEYFLIDQDINKGPIETSLINENIYPSVIVSFFSSALFSLDKIFDDTLIYSVKIEERDLIKKEKNMAIINSCYAFLENTSVVSIDDF